MMMMRRAMIMKPACKWNDNEKMWFIVFRYKRSQTFQTRYKPMAQVSLKIEYWDFMFCIPILHHKIADRISLSSLLDLFFQRVWRSYQNIYKWTKGGLITTTKIFAKISLNSRICGGLGERLSAVHAISKHHRWKVSLFFIFNSYDLIVWKFWFVSSMQLPPEYAQNRISGAMEKRSCAQKLKSEFL